MNILFLSLLDMKSFDDENIYMDLLNEFIDNGHKVFIVSPTERRNKEKTNIIEKNSSKILRVKTGNIQKTNIIEKGITTVLIESVFKHAIKKYYKGIKFDLVLYATPPITLCNVIKYIKKRDNAKTYLMLKDIFPQNAVDLGMFSKKSIFYKYFRNKEINLYKMSDRIGCMSPKNVEYLLEHNSYIDKKKVEVCPNSIKIREKNKFNPELRKKYREKYNIPEEAKVFVYGGNLGKPQGVDFIVECLKKCSDIDNCYFVICGTGTDYYQLDNYVKLEKPKHVILINGLSKEEYNEFLNIGDVGLIFLDYRFTIPNFPSRILSYMEKEMPILACTDPNTDVGDIIEDNGFGWKCYSNNSIELKKEIDNIKLIDKKELKEYGSNSIKYLNDNYSSSKIVKLINKK